MNVTTKTRREVVPLTKHIGAEIRGIDLREKPDDTTVKVLATLKTITGRIWTYVRNDLPFATVVRTTFDDNELSTVKSRLLSSRSPRVPLACQRR